MLITITVTSIVAVTALVWLANKILPFTVCPICAGVSLTWAGLLAAHFLDYSVDLVIPALLMGGTVVGIAYQLEKKSRNMSTGQLLLRKTLFIPAGFIAAYGILAELWAVSAGALAFLLLVTFLLRRFNLRSPDSGGLTSGSRETAEEIEKKMKDCC